MIVPVRVLYAQSHGASLAIIGAMASAYLISNFLFQYPFGWLADRWGRKQVMVIGLVAQATLSLAYLLISDLKAKAPDLYQKLLVDRNVRWAQKMETMLRDSGVQLVAVGAAHLAGPIAYKRNS